jgi:hypothetical protein
MDGIDWQAVAKNDSRILAEVPQAGDFVAVPCTRKDCPNKEPHLEIVEVTGVTVSTRDGNFKTDKQPVYLVDPGYLLGHDES